MTSLPDRPDLHQLRIQAKELKRALSAGKSEALERVLASHPKYAGRPAERAEGRVFTLRDSQVTIARELGFDSWKTLVDEVGPAAPRWGSMPISSTARRAMHEAYELHHRDCAHDHFLLALLKPPEPTIAFQVLTDLGATYESVLERSNRLHHRTRVKRTFSTPMYQYTLGWSEGLAIGTGVHSVTDEQVLLALAYGTHGGESILYWFDLDPDEVVDRLHDRGVPTPSFGPPAAQPPIGPVGDFVYFPEEDYSSVSKAIIELVPPRSQYWVTDRSRWKIGYRYVFGEDDIPLEAIVRGAVKNNESVEVLPEREGKAHERLGDRRRRSARRRGP